MFQSQRKMIWETARLILISVFSLKDPLPTSFYRPLAGLSAFGVITRLLKSIIYVTI
jgi:hypothetical protein